DPECLEPEVDVDEALRLRGELLGIAQRGTGPLAVRLGERPLRRGPRLRSPLHACAAPSRLAPVLRRSRPCPRLCLPVCRSTTPPDSGHSDRVPPRRCLVMNLPARHAPRDGSIARSRAAAASTARMTSSTSKGLRITSAQYVAIRRWSSTEKALGGEAGMRTYPWQRRGTARC